MSPTEQLEERITRSLSDTLARDLPAGDLAAVRRSGLALRRRHRWVVAAAAAAAVAVVAGLVVAWPERAERPEPVDMDVTGSWERVPAPPLSPRTEPIVAWTGAEVLVLGGDTGKPCDLGPGTWRKCQTDRESPAQDGAAYDPESGTWRTIADPPARLGRPSGVMVDGLLIIEDERRWYAYQPGRDRWLVLSRPTILPGQVRVAYGRWLYAVDDGGRVVALNVRSDRWTTLPELPSNGLPTNLLATERGLVAVVEGEPSAYAWDGRWSALSSDDLEVLEDTERPARPSSADAAEWQVNVYVGDGPLSGSGGAVYDTRTDEWSLHGRPDSRIDVGMRAVWVRGRLFFFGGAEADGEPSRDDLVNEAWVWTP